MTPLERLQELEACAAAKAWVEAQGDASPQQMWDACPHGDWMLWLLKRSGVDCSAVGYACAERARQSALRALPASPERDALAACRPIVDCETAGYGYSAAYDAASRAASDAAYAASDAAYAASDAAYAAYDAAYDAAYAASAASAASDAEREAIADLVRESFPHPPEGR